MNIKIKLETKENSLDRTFDVEAIASMQEDELGRIVLEMANQLTEPFNNLF